MPVDDIQVKRIPAARVAELTATAARLEPASINPVIQPLYRELRENGSARQDCLARWIDQNGYRSSGHVRELTLECPDDPDKWVTELQEPITPA